MIYIIGSCVKELRGRSTTVQGSEIQEKGKEKRGGGVNKSHSVERIRKNLMEDMRGRELEARK
jgi:hypothetical protein